MREKATIFITTQAEFLHQYENAPEEVSYLRYPHRHIAHIEIEVQVFGDDREIEFIMLKHRVEKFLDSLGLTKCTGVSCEMICRRLKEFMINEYGNHREIKITVSEDGENGSRLYYVPEGGLV